MKKIAVLLSGGVDSLVSAHLLKDQGYPVFGIHFYTGYEIPIHDETSIASTRDAANPFNARDNAEKTATKLEHQLQIPVHVLDIGKMFKRTVVDYFTDLYQLGRTPNPCMVCNPQIKFGICLSWAKDTGATHMATGHYARLIPDDGGIMRLYRGRDRNKDQSYFLARLKPDVLNQSMLPLGDFNKKDTLALAKKFNLQPVAPQESQDICFISHGSYGEFLTQQPGFKSQPGPIMNTQGKVVGRHQGLHQYTIGQRRGINIPAAEPYYVIRIDAKQNRLIIGFKKETYSKSCRVKDINWLHGPPKHGIQLATRIRYRHTATTSTVTPQGEHDALVQFKTPQSAITPGQAAVFYHGDEVLGGGWIELDHH